MDLVTQVKTKANTQVLVEGTIYKINEVGVIHDISEEHANVLLENINWRVVGEEVKPPKKKYSPPKITSVKLVDSNGEVIPGQISDEEENAEAKDEAKAKADAIKDPPIPKEGEEWPDPSESYTMEWLKACADAYSISYHPNIGPVKLVEKIKKEMYE